MKSDMTTVAHISDIHLGPLPPVQLRQLLNKRLTGYLNWAMMRRHALSDRTLDSLTNHLKAHQPDLVAVSGDLVNLALPLEFERAGDWLSSLGPAAKVAVVPGNHDSYVGTGLDNATDKWGDYMRGRNVDGKQFPFWRQCNDVALIGCSSAITTPPLHAHGKFNVDQARRLGKILQQTRQAGLYRVVMIHHPPHNDVRQIWRRGLRGRDLFRKVVHEHGAELVLHGHLHKSMMNSLDGPEGKIPLVGIASAAGNADNPASGRYNLFTIAKTAARFTCSMTEFGVNSADGAVEQHRQMMLHRDQNSRTWTI